VLNVLVFTLLSVLLTGKIRKLKIAKTDSKKVNCCLRKLINKKEELEW
jgi:hypothetical protein